MPDGPLDEETFRELMDPRFRSVMDENGNVFQVRLPATDAQGQVPANERFQGHNGMMMMPPPPPTMAPTAQHTNSIQHDANHFGRAMVQPRQGGAVMNQPNQGAVLMPQPNQGVPIMNQLNQGRPVMMRQPNQGSNGMAQLNQVDASTNQTGHGATVATQQRPDVQEPPIGLDGDYLYNPSDPLAPSGGPPMGMPHPTQEAGATQADANLDSLSSATIQTTQGGASSSQENPRSVSVGNAANPGSVDLVAYLDPDLRAFFENCGKETGHATPEDKEPDQPSRTISPESGPEPEAAGESEEPRI